MAFTTAVIGRTGHGDWGHAIDELFVELPGTRLVAVADASPEGLAAATKRLGLDRGFDDWRRMLSEVRPEIVVDAIEQDREPETGMYASRTTVLMTEAVFQSAVSGERVPV